MSCVSKNRVACGSIIGGAIVTIATNDIYSFHVIQDACDLAGLIVLCPMQRKLRVNSVNSPKEVYTPTPLLSPCSLQ